MWSTPKKRLFELKKELKKIKKTLDRKNKYAREHNRPPVMLWDIDHGDVSYYIAIDSDGNEYTIGLTAIDMSIINFDKLVYIRKDVNYYMYDSDIGLYRESVDYSYHTNVDKKYHVSNEISVGCEY